MAGKLSNVQRRAYNKLKKRGGWQSSYDLHESMATMGALEKKGLVVCRGRGKLGSMFSPQTVIEYKVRR